MVTGIGQLFMRSLTLFVVSLVLAQAAAPSVAQTVGNGLPNAAHPRGFHFRSANETMLVRHRYTAQVLSLIETAQWRQFLTEGGFGIRPVSVGSTTYLGNMDAIDLALPEREHKALAKAGLPTRLDRAMFEMQAGLSQPLSVGALKDGALKRIELSKVLVVFADMSASGSGQVTIDDNALMQGQVEATFTNWQHALKLMDFESEAQRRAIEVALRRLAQGDTVSVTLQIKDSNLMLGPIALTSISRLIDDL